MRCRRFSFSHNRRARHGSRIDNCRVHPAIVAVPPGSSMSRVLAGRENRDLIPTEDAVIPVAPGAAASLNRRGKKIPRSLQDYIWWGLMACRRWLLAVVASPLEEWTSETSTVRCATLLDMTCEALKSDFHRRLTTMRRRQDVPREKPALLRGKAAMRRDLNRGSISRSSNSHNEWPPARRS